VILLPGFSLPLGSHISSGEYIEPFAYGLMSMPTFMKVENLIYTITVTLEGTLILTV
jgi:hypothetical protein